MSAHRQQLVNEHFAAEYLGVAVRTLQWWRSVGRGPRFVKIGRLVRYRIREDLDAYIEAGLRQSTSEEA